VATPQKIRCQVQQITAHGDHVYTVDLTPDRPVPRFRPGQFLHLTLDDYDPSGFWPESRVFSIASSPVQRDRLRISYSVKGSYTTRMEKELHPGLRVWVKLPYGNFVIQEASGDIVLLAGGTGITAFISFIEGLPGPPAALHDNIFLAYGARKPALLLYRETITAKAVHKNEFHAFYFVENGAAPAATVATGCLSINAIWNRLENSRTATFYIAGPPAMIQVLTGNLLNKNIAPDKIKVDAWE
jgi:ferredoxin-NADP reductase